MKKTSIALNLLFAITAIVTVLFSSGCASQALVVSTLRTQEIKIDGSTSDWSSVPLYLDKESGLGFRVCHDTGAIYLSLSASGRNLQEGLMRGVTIWFDKSGGNDKVFGVGLRMPRPEGRNDRRESKVATGASVAMSVPPLTDVEIVRPDAGENYRVPVGTDAGIQAAFGKSAEGIVSYELKVPFAKTARTPDAIECQGLTAVGVGIESASASAEPRGDEPGQGGPGGGPPGMPPGGMESGGGRPGSMPGGGPPSGGPPDRNGLQQLSINLWLKIMMNAQ
jgi:hypothetical protein